MAQSTTGLSDEVQGGSLTAAEYNTLRSTVDNNATDAESRIDHLETSHGFVDYNHDNGSTALVADTWTDVPNNAAGAYTNTTYKPDDVTSLIDASTGYLDFSDLSLGSELLIRSDFTVVPNTNNSLLEVRYLLGSGAGEYQLLFWSERLDGGSGIDYQRVIPFPIYMGDLNTKNNPGKLQVKLSTSGTLTNAGSYISIRVK